jgi:hypothetical protein
MRVFKQKLALANIFALAKTRLGPHCLLAPT